jgi:hypothetical protein
MVRPSIKGQRLIALFLCGCLLLNYPILSLFSSSGGIFGVPVLYVFVFLAWGALIALMAAVVEKRDD